MRDVTIMIPQRGGAVPEVWEALAAADINVEAAVSFSREHHRVVHVVVEDAVAGVEAAKRAGMGCIAVTTTSPASALGAADIVVDRAALDDLEKQLADAASEDACTLYLAVRRAKRRIAMTNPAIDFSQLLMIDQSYPGGGREWKHEAIHRLGHRAVPGGRLLVLDGLHPGGRVRQLFPPKPGSFWRPELSFDGKRVLFCFKPHDEKSFHLYEINLDGSGLRQLTDSQYDDIDPIYLPDGHIMFTTTRGNTYVRCGPYIYSYALARCDADGKNVYLISTNSEPDFVPALLDDGRVVYSRWEYSDKDQNRVQSLWTTNQDGTGTTVLWGNQSVWPDLLKDARSIPDSRRVMFTGSAHHNWFSGSVGIIDPDKGYNLPHGLTKVTADVAWPESGNGPGGSGCGTCRAIPRSVPNHSAPEPSRKAVLTKPLGRPSAAV
mgnify:CR=1 FL=1